MVNLEWYRTFKAIYQHGNLTRAAEDLLISQPNVSIQLASLESYIGHRLFERKPRKLIPTEYGKLLYTQIVESVENLERVEAEFRRTALKRQENLRIGSPIEYAHNILLDKLKGCEANVNLRFGFPDELIIGLENKELDFAILTKKSDNQKYIFEPLEEERFMIVAHATYNAVELERYIANGDLDAVEKWLLQQDWVAYDNKLSIIRRFWRDNFHKRPLIKPRYVIPNIDMMLKAVRLNYGITVASNLLVEDSLVNQQLRILWKENDTEKNQLWLAYNPLHIDEKLLIIMKNLLTISTAEV